MRNRQTNDNWENEHTFSVDIDSSQKITSVYIISLVLSLELPSSLWAVMEDKSSKDRDSLTDRMFFASTYLAGRFLLLCWYGSGYRLCDFCGRRKWPIDSRSCIVAENCIIRTIMFYTIYVICIDLLKTEKLQKCQNFENCFPHRNLWKYFNKAAVIQLSIQFCSVI